MGCLYTRAKYIYEDGQKFFARGLSYGPFAPNSREESYPERDRAEADFVLMREMGANLIRTYTMPPAWLIELAAKHELRLMVGISWPLHLTFLDSPEMTREIRETVRREVAALRPFKDTIFAYGLGNEIRSDIVRWHGPRAVRRFLAELYDIGKQLDPEGLFTYSNYPSVEYLDLSFLDIVSFNVYLHREPDFRRYLTHLMALTGERPLVLSETGIDTIREGQAHQAELLGWQSRAALELGLSGLVVFAFTDEWFRGGFEITDWAFGLTTRERLRKASFAAVERVFRGPLPPPLADAPTATVIVPAYNAAATLRQCLESLKQLNYPNYEIIVVDDGSTDDTAKIAESAGIHTLRLPHNGLAVARNAGLEIAHGRIVAFIDADAQADRDWLYHLVEAITRRDAVAAGGQNFAPPPNSALAAAIAMAPGQPKEVRLGDQDLAQLCGCSMGIDTFKCARTQLFDPMFTAAGDDVDLSWSLRDAGMSLAYAPGAVVIHHRRATVGSYLRQQRGYGQAEGLLFRKYPGRAREGMYGGSGWFANWFGGAPRIYYGTFGHALFQTIYPGRALPMAAQLPLTYQWLAIAIALALVGFLSSSSLGNSFARYCGLLGLLGLLMTVLCACIGAASADTGRTGFGGRVLLALLWLFGPLIRGWGRLESRRFRPDSSGIAKPARRALSGTIACTITSRISSSPQERPVPAAESELEALAGALHGALVRRGLTVKKGTSYDPFDLQIIIPSSIRVALVFLNREENASIAWRTHINWGGLVAIFCAAFGVALMIFSLGGSLRFHWLGAPVLAGVFVTASLFAYWLNSARDIPAVISAACEDIARQSELLNSGPLDRKVTAGIAAE